MPVVVATASLRTRRCMRMSTFHPDVRRRHGVLVAPTTRMGLRAVQAAGASVVGFVALTIAAILASESAPPGAPTDPKGLLMVVALTGTAVGLVCAVGAGALGLVAIIRRSERAVAVYLALLPLIMLLLLPLHSLFIND